MSIKHLEGTCYSQRPGAGPICGQPRGHGGPHSWERIEGIRRGPYGLNALNRLEESLDATSVLSDDFKRNIMGWVFKAIEEAAMNEREKES